MIKQDNNIFVRSSYPYLRIRRYMYVFYTFIRSFVQCFSDIFQASIFQVFFKYFSSIFQVFFNQVISLFQSSNINNNSPKVEPFVSASDCVV